MGIKYITLSEANDQEGEIPMLFASQLPFSDPNSSSTTLVMTGLPDQLFTEMEIAESFNYWTLLKLPRSSQ